MNRTITRRTAKTRIFFFKEKDFRCSIAKLLIPVADGDSFLGFIGSCHF